MLSSGFSFFSEIINIDGHTLDLIDGYKIRKATLEEINAFKPLLPVNAIVKYSRYEIEWQKNGSGRHSGNFIEDIQNWKYWGVSFEGNGNERYEIGKIFNLLSNNVDLAFTVFYYSKVKKIIGHTGISPICGQLTSNPGPTPTIIIDSDWISEFEKNWTAYNKLDEEYSFINHAIDNFNSLKVISSGSDLLIVGYFSIIESLITHPPRLAESLDSINHQLRNKMILLCKRFGRTTDLEEFFPATKAENVSATKEETVWKKLYHYRSNIAHGTKPDFKKELSILKDKGTVIKFLRETVKNLIVYALEEPQFINDLKKC